MKKSKRRPIPVVRCAIYTRKSTEEGLDQDFNSLDAQRECAEAFVKSQAAEGWVCLAERYDDGGYSGGNTERPALRRLLADVEAGMIDAVLVYKLDRLSRSLLDFARLMETFERHQVSFVSVTQQFNSATSMGRLILNVLLSFAQFEREIISERTRDKIAATRRKGKWSGGMPLLGYDLEPGCSRLIVNEAEAERVRAIFELYRQQQSLLAVVAKLERRGWTNKRWTTRKGHQRGGKPFTRTTLHHLLTNPTYLGKVRYKQELHAGEHPAIVPEQLWSEVQTLLRQNGQRTVGTRNGSAALLKGLLHCQACGCAMTPSHTLKNGRRPHHYYVCSRALRFGRHACPAPELPARELERFIVGLVRQQGENGAGILPPQWEGLPVAERRQLFQTVVERVDYDAVQSKVTITFTQGASA